MKVSNVIHFTVHTVITTPIKAEEHDLIEETVTDAKEGEIEELKIQENTVAATIQSTMYIALKEQLEALQKVNLVLFFSSYFNHILILQLFCFFSV